MTHYKNYSVEHATKVQKREFELITKIQKLEALIIELASSGLHLVSKAAHDAQNNVIDDYHAEMNKLTSELLFQANGFENYHQLPSKHSHYLQIENNNPCVNT